MLRWVEAGPRIHPLSPRGYGGGAVSQAAASRNFAHPLSSQCYGVRGLPPLSVLSANMVDRRGVLFPASHRPLSYRLIRPVEVVFLLPLHPLFPQWIRY